MLASMKKGCTFAVPNNERGNVKKEVWEVL